MADEPETATVQRFGPMTVPSRMNATPRRKKAQSQQAAGYDGGRPATSGGEDARIGSATIIWGLAVVG